MGNDDGILVAMPGGQVLGSYRGQDLPPFRELAALEAANLAIETTHKQIGPVLLTRGGRKGWNVQPAGEGFPYLTACVTIEAAYRLTMERKREFSATEQMVLDLFRAERAMTPMAEDVGEDPEGHFRERFNMLPPLAWHRGPNGESFRLCEARVLDVHPTFCRLPDSSGRWRYFRGMKRVGVTHQEILDECRRLIA